RSSACSGGVEDTLSEEVQFGSSIHLAFEELQPRHMPLRWLIAVWELEGRVHGRILLESRGEAFQVWQATCQDRLDPGLQLGGRPLTHHLGKGLRERSNLGNRGIMPPYLHDLFLRIWCALLWVTHQEIRELSGR